MKLFRSLSAAIEDASYHLEYLSYPVHTETWQSLDITNKPEMKTYEVLNWGFVVNLASSPDRETLVEQVKPNLPWADQHFTQERVSGSPINPGTTWKDWPWGNSADKFRREGEKFSHTYAERYWPKLAEDGVIGQDSSERSGEWGYQPHQGIRYEYGDLNDVVNLLAKQPNTRQAYLPVWFPEDTGVVHGERVPCSLGYHFIQRNGYLHCSYWLRSCDFIRHFRDDIYLSIRLQEWILEKLRAIDPKWDNIKLGSFSMWTTSLHIFSNDYRKLYSHPHRSDSC